MNNEDIKTVEQIIDKCKNCKLKECINCEINWNQVQAIENLLKENEELKKLLNAKIGVDLSYEDYIPVAKIKEKLEISKKQYEWFNNDKRPTKNIAKAYEIVIEFLQEFVEGK